MRFALNKIGLYVFDIKDSSNGKSVTFNKKINSYSLEQTEEKNGSNCTSTEIKRANKAKTLARRMGSTPLRSFSSLLNNK